MIATYSPCDDDDPDLIVHRHATGGRGGSATRIIYLQEAQMSSDERLRRGVSENLCVVWSAPDSPVGSEARCPTCKGTGDAGWVVSEDGPNYEACPDCRGTGHERVIPATDPLTSLRAWVAEVRREFGGKARPYARGKANAAEEVAAILDEYPAEAPSGGER